MCELPPGRSFGDLKMQKIILFLCVMLMASVSSAAIRFHGNGSWDMLEGVGQAEGWQSATPPGSGDTVRANWGNTTVTLNYQTTVNRFQLGITHQLFHIPLTPYSTGFKSTKW